MQPRFFNFCNGGNKKQTLILGLNLTSFEEALVFFCGASPVKDSGPRAKERDMYLGHDCGEFHRSMLPLGKVRGDVFLPVSTEATTKINPET